MHATRGAPAPFTLTLLMIGNIFIGAGVLAPAAADGAWAFAQALIRAITDPAAPPG